MAKRLAAMSKVVGLAVTLTFALFPFWWMIITSFKTGKELYSDTNPLWPSYPTLANYRQLLANTKFLRWVFNSLTLSSISTILTLVLATPAAYAIARMRSPHTRAFGISAILGYGLPPALLLVPMFSVVTTIGAYDTPWVLILVYPSFLIPFATWLIAGYIKGVPQSIEDAARIDGCTRLQALTYVVLPAIRTGLLSALAFCFFLAWGEYVYALGLVASGNLRTLPVGLASLEAGDIYEWGRIMAAAVLTTLPVVLLLLLFRRRLVPGLTAGAIRK